MPHLQLELSAQAPERADLTRILRGLVETLCTFETIDPKSVKAYARIAEHYATGDGAPEGFVSLTVCVLAGRDETLLARISAGMEAALRDHFSESLSRGLLGATVEVREMNPRYYRK